MAKKKSLKAKSLTIVMRNLRSRRGRDLPKVTHSTGHKVKSSLFPYAARCQEVGDPGEQIPTFTGGGIREQGLVNDQP